MARSTLRERIRPIALFGLRAVGGLLLSASSAALATLAFPPVSVGPFILVAFVPMVVAQHLVFHRYLSGLALAVGIGGFYLAYGWGVLPDEAGEQIRWGIVILAGVLAMAGAVERFMHEATAYRLPFLFAPLVWVAADFLRRGVPEVATWGYPAYALFEWPSLIQPVAVTGILGLNFLILAVNWSFARLVLVAVDGRRFNRPGAARSLALVGAGVAAWMVGSPLLLHEPSPDVRVAAFQPGRSLSFYDFDPEHRSPVPGAYLVGTRTAADAGARLVVWPEYGLGFDPRVTATTELRDLARRTDAYIAIGYGLIGPEGNRNEAVVLTPKGAFLGPYGKHHPVTILGEASTTRYGYPVYPTEVGRLTTIICYDLDFLDSAREVARNGAQLVAVPSSDWGSIAHKHYPLLVFRAVENRLAMVKADSAYGSSIIDPYGRILKRAVAPHGSSALLVADVPLGSGRSPAVWLGDRVGWAVVALVLALVGRFLQLASRRRRAGALGAPTPSSTETRRVRGRLAAKPNLFRSGRQPLGPTLRA